MADEKSLTEIGVSGLLRQGGTIYEEYLRELQGDRWARVIKQMVTDPVIGAVLFAVEMVIRRVDWSIQPGSDSSDDVATSEFVSECYQDMSASWPDTLAEILSFLPWGWCLPADATVLDGAAVPIAIDKISPGDSVLTGEGRAKIVNRVFSREYDGELIEVSVAGYPEPVRLTPEHRLPTTRGWKRADELVAGDTLLRPRLSLREGGDYLAGWIVGVYLAEGHLPVDKRHRVTFSVHRREGEYLAARLSEYARDEGLLNRYAQTPQGRNHERGENAAEVTISATAIRGLIEEWVSGNRSHLKRFAKLPTEREFAQGAWDGWLWGDGHHGTVEKGGREYALASGVTTSRALAHQLQVIGGSLGLPSHVSKRPGGIGWIRGRRHLTREFYVIGALPQRRVIQKRTPDAEARVRALRATGWPMQKIARKCGLSYLTVWRWLHSTGPRVQGLQCEVTERTVHHAVQAIRHVPYTGTVHDLEVEEDHTFCAGVVTVSNCYLETVYKRRGGSTEDGTSKYTDGRIGWRKFAIRSQDTLSHWEFDEKGGVRGMWQHDPYSGKPTVLIPIEKALLFRTTSRKNSPEGVSIFRSSYECFDPATELSTARGWVAVGEVTTDDKVLTLSPDGGMEYQSPTALHDYDYDGDMLHVHGHFLDQMVTPNHNLYVRPAHKDTFELKEANDVCKTVYFKRDGRWDAPDIPDHVIPEWVDGTGRKWPALTVPMDDWLNVLGIFIAEGSCTFYENEDRQQRTVHICQNEGDKADVIRGWLSKMPFHVGENQHEKKINFRITRGQIYNELVGLGKAKTKHVPKYVGQCSARQIKRFLMAFQFGDGSRANDSTVLYTSSKALADDLQELAVKAGYVTTIRWQKSTGFGKGVEGAGVFKLVLAQSATGGYRARSFDRVPYTGKVFCVTVPNHTVYARRNGKACWSGNSWYFRRNIARIEAIGIERDLAGYPVFRIPGSIIVAAGDVYEAWKTVAVNMRRDEQEALILPSDVDAETKVPLYDVKLLSTGGSRQFDAQPVDAKVLTPTGWKRMGDLKVGDAVVDPLGSSSKVLGVFPKGRRQAYRVTMADGRSTLVDGRHLWTVTTAKWKSRKVLPNSHPLLDKYRVLRTEELTQRRSGTRFQVPPLNPVEFQRAAPLLLDPYTLGVLLGDGTLYAKANVEITTADDELKQNVAALLPSRDYLRHYQDPNAGLANKVRICGHERLERACPAGYKSGGFLNRASATRLILQDLGLLGKKAADKFIPDIYIWSSVQSRVSVLQGLMDTDGTIDAAGFVSFGSTSKQLALDVLHIIRSLGGNAGLHSRVMGKGTLPRKSGPIPHEGGPYHWLKNIRLPEGIIPFRLQRKVSRMRPFAYTMHNSIASVRPEGEAEMQCILVSAPSHMYVTDDFIPTHNTNAIVARYDQRIMAACLADFLLLGTKTGSYALSSDKTDLFETALNTWCESIAGVINSHAIPRLLRLNGIKTDKPPVLKAAPLEHVDLGILGKYINDLAGAGLPLFPTADGKLESELIEKGGLSAPAPEAFVEAAAQQAAADEAERAEMAAQLKEKQNPNDERSTT